MEIKYESPNICETCLSVGRKLKPLGNYESFLNKIVLSTGLDYHECNLASLNICWECESSISNIFKFINKVKTATVRLKDRFNHPKTLSTLKKVINKQIINAKHEEYDAQNIKPLIEIVKNNKPVKIYKNESNNHINEYDDQMVNINNDFKSEFTQNVMRSDRLFATDFSYLEIKEECVNDPYDEAFCDNNYDDGDNDLIVIKTENKESDKTKKYDLIERPNHESMKLVKCVMSETEMVHSRQLKRESEYFQSTPYKCLQCVYVFNSKKSLMKHNTNLHSLNTEHKCQICQSTFKAKTGLMVHVKSHFLKYSCSACSDEVTGSRKEIMRFLMLHRRVLKCLVCGLEFDTHRQFTHHYKELHSKYICDHCGAVKTNKISIEKHMAIHKDNFPCELCTKQYPSLIKLKRHKLRHTGAELAYCVECDKKFANQLAYKTHLSNTLKHRKERVAIPCPECNKLFTKRNYMKNHFDFFHLNLKRHQCQQCDKHFVRKEHLTRHILSVHQGVPKTKDKPCYICGRPFSSNTILMHHIRTHTGERPHACDFCPAKFAQKYAMKTHIKSIHMKRDDGVIL